MNLKIIQLLFFLLMMNSCTSTSVIDSSDKLDQVYISSGVEDYIHLDIPHWANFSVEGKCFRNQPVKFLNFYKLNKSMSLSYTQSVHLQHMMNKKLNNYRTNSGTNQIALKDEAFVFHNVYQQVMGNSFDFSLPKFEKINLLWIDPFLGNDSKIKNIVQSTDFLSGYPVLISTCLSSAELEELTAKLKIEEFGVKFIPAEMLSIYDSQFLAKPNFSFYLNEILINKKVKLYSSTRPKNIFGNFEFVEVK